MKLFLPSWANAVRTRFLTAKIILKNNFTAEAQGSQRMLKIGMHMHCEFSCRRISSWEKRKLAGPLE